MKFHYMTLIFINVKLVHEANSPVRTVLQLKSLDHQVCLMQRAKRDCWRVGNSRMISSLQY